MKEYGRRRLGAVAAVIGTAAIVMVPISIALLSYGILSYEEPLSSSELQKLTSLLGIVPPTSMRSARVYFRSGQIHDSFLIKASFHSADIVEMERTQWLLSGSEVVQIGFETQDKALAPAWFDDAVPVLGNDIRFRKVQESISIFGLLRAGTPECTFYLEGEAAKGVFPSDLVSALLAYPRRARTLILGPIGLMGERYWECKGAACAEDKEVRE